MQKVALKNKQIEKLKTILGKHSTFREFSRTKKDAYSYVSIIGLRVCPYCNIQFIYSVYEKENADGVGGSHESYTYRAELDHFAPKSNTPSKELAQENLIPACQQCNQRVKFRTEFARDTHLHPFYDDFDSLKRFSINLESADIFDGRSFEIIFCNKEGNASDLKRANKTIRDLKLLSRYRYHRIEVIDLFKKARFYHNRKIEELEDLTSTADLRRHLFSEEHAKINEVPLGKLKRDILRLILQ